MGKRVTRWPGDDERLMAAAQAALDAVSEHADDPQRVLLAWVAEALSRFWPRPGQADAGEAA